MSVAEHAGWYAIWNTPEITMQVKAREALASGIWGQIADQLLDAVEYTVKMAVMNSAREVAKGVAHGGTYAVAKKAAETAAKDKATSGDYKAVGLQVAKAVLRHAISNEETVYSALSQHLACVELPVIPDLEGVIDTVLAADPAQFVERNLAKCWYVSRIWDWICLIKPANLDELKGKFVHFVERCHDPIITCFAGWIIGPGFSRAGLLEQMKSFSHGLPPCLLDIVYDYLAPPCPRLIRKEILSLI